MKLECHAGAEGVISEPRQGGLAGSCNAVFPKLGHIPKRNKDLVLTHTDDHGQPTLAAVHGVCAAGSSGSRQAQRLRLELLLEGLGRTASCAYEGTDCRYALGNTRRHRSLGSWSDGVPVAPLKIQDAAPIRP